MAQAGNIDFIEDVVVDDQRIDLAMDVGGQFEVEMFIENDDGSEFDLTGYSFDGSIETKNGDPITDFDFAVLDAVGGRLLVSVAQAVTATLGAFVGCSNRFAIYFTDPLTKREKEIFGDQQIRPAI